MKRNNFYVIGGQYQPTCYGGAPTLIGARRLANKHWQYWDNWQGWHRPKIFRAEDTFIDVDGDRCPHIWAEPLPNSKPRKSKAKKKDDSYEQWEAQFYV